ncbi:uncharacterized [Tachysurus ichikawai]
MLKLWYTHAAVVAVPCTSRGAGGAPGGQAVCSWQCDVYAGPLREAPHPPGSHPLSLPSPSLCPALQRASALGEQMIPRCSSSGLGGTKLYYMSQSVLWALASFYLVLERNWDQLADFRTALVINAKCYR